MRTVQSLHMVLDDCSVTRCLPCLRALLTCDLGVAPCTPECLSLTKCETGDDNLAGLIVDRMIKACEACGRVLVGRKHWVKGSCFVTVGEAS